MGILPDPRMRQSAPGTSYAQPCALLTEILGMDNADDFRDAMSADYGTRSKTGALFTEILGMVSVIEHTRSHVPQWMRATKLMRLSTICFSPGSPSVGAQVQKAAGHNLVPVTLELGGKNPVMVSPHADITRAATRIATSRMINGGQVCTCPDDVFVPDKHIDAFVDVARETLRGMFPTIVSNDDYCSCVNDANFDRVLGLTEDARANGATVEVVAPAGESLPDRETRKIAPTIVLDIDEHMKIANEEKFDPVLAVRPYSVLTDVIDHLNQRAAPLVAYWYGPENDEFRRFVRSTCSGMGA
jgi:acyl-CoA reductase-like NAD-dependent aldehyde dehydrogenase